MTQSEITRRDFNAGAASGVAALGTASTALGQTTEPFDLVIRNGRVMAPRRGSMGLPMSA